jgi:hypothetical protein
MIVKDGKRPSEQNSAYRQDMRKIPLKEGIFLFAERDILVTSLPVTNIFTSNTKYLADASAQ